MNKQLELLIKLQTIDLEVEGINDISNKIEIDTEKLKKSLSLMQEEVKATKNRIEELNKMRKKKEWEVEDEKINLKKTQDKSREIKTNKEYVAFLKEIEDKKKKIFAKEDEILNLMELIDEEGKRLKEKENQLKEEETRFQGEKEKKKEEKMALKNLLNKKLEERKNISPLLDQKLYKVYCLLKETKGKAVVRVLDGACLGCHLTLPPQHVNEVRKNEEIISCIYCNRMLYWPIT